MSNNATKFNLTDYLLATLAVQARQIADAGHNGWGNTMTSAADEITRLRAEVDKCKSAITAYLAEVPLPEGWIEERDGPCCRYWEVIEGIEYPVERVIATANRVTPMAVPRHWPAIPLPVLIRAAVQCHRLREAGRA